MNYVIGVEHNTNKLNRFFCEIELDNPENTFTFHTDCITKLFSNILCKHELVNIVIRIKQDCIKDSDIIICKELGVCLSVIIDFEMQENDLLALINKLTLSNIIFECVFLDAPLDNRQYSLFIGKLISDKGISVRFINSQLSIKRYLTALKAIQDSIFASGSNLLLNILDSYTEKQKVDCIFAFIDTDTMRFYDLSISLNNKENLYNCSIDAINPAYYLLAEVNCYSQDGFLYLRDEAVKKLQSRVLLNRADSCIKIDNRQKYDIVFVFANRFRSMISYAFPSPGLYYLNTLAKDRGYSSKVIECTENSFISEFNSIATTMIIGFYCTAENETLIRNMIRYIKTYNDSIKIIVGGPQSLSLNYDFFEYSGADVVVEGEGEGPLVDLLDLYINGIGSLDNIGNVKYIQNKKLVVNKQRELIKSLDSYPYTKLTRKEAYKYADMSSLPILTGRGCHFRCTFCYEGANARVVRYRSMECVFDEIGYLLSEFPLATAIQVLDDTFTADSHRVYEFCNGMRKIRETRQISWICEAHIHTLYNKPEMLAYMLESGLIGIQVGIESGSDFVLKAYKKNTNVQMIKDFIDMCADMKHHFAVQGNIILGGPFESKDTIFSNLELCRYLIERGRGIIELLVVCFTPLPNTDITLNPDKYGIKILWKEVDAIITGMNSIVTQSDYLTREEIEDEKNNLTKTIHDIYRYETLKLEPDKVIWFWDSARKCFAPRSIWGDILNGYEHFRNYALSRTFDDPKPTNFSSQIFPIRTFERIRYLDEIYLNHEISINDIDKKILKMCNGKYSIEDISSALCIDINALEILLNLLEKRCLLYYSKF